MTGGEVLSYTNTLAYATSGAPAAQASASGSQPSFTICYEIPDGFSHRRRSAAHLRADPRYRNEDRSTLQLERIHVELGPFRSNSSLDWFVAVSGLWADARWRSITCSGDLRGKAELWGLLVHFQHFEPHGTELPAVVHPESQGFQIVQVPLPPAATVLHFVDSGGAKVATDVNLRGS